MQICLQSTTLCISASNLEEGDALLTATTVTLPDNTKIEVKNLKEEVDEFTLISSTTLTANNLSVSAHNSNGNAIELNTSGSGALEATRGDGTASVTPVSFGSLPANSAAPGAKPIVTSVTGDWSELIVRSAKLSSTEAQQGTYFTIVGAAPDFTIKPKAAAFNTAGNYEDTIIVTFTNGVAATAKVTLNVYTPSTDNPGGGGCDAGFAGAGLLLAASIFAAHKAGKR
jgi:hypothetical protein